MPNASYQRVRLSALKRRSGLALRDGSRVQYVSYYLHGTIDSVGKRQSGSIHRAQEACGIEYFATHGYSIFPYHIGIHHKNGWADFAASRFRRVILVECLTDWREGAIERKLDLMAACELWFITQQGYMKDLRKKYGYRCNVLSNYERHTDIKMWICRPKETKAL